MRWLKLGPNALSLLRPLLLAYPLYWCTVNGYWLSGYYLVIAVLITDFADGEWAIRLKIDHLILGKVLDKLGDVVAMGAALAGLYKAGRIELLWMLICFGTFFPFHSLFYASRFGHGRWIRKIVPETIKPVLGFSKTVINAVIVFIVVQAYAIQVWSPAGVGKWYWQIRCFYYCVGLVMIGVLTMKRRRLAAWLNIKP